MLTFSHIKTIKNFANIFQTSFKDVQQKIVTISKNFSTQSPFNET